MAADGGHIGWAVLVFGRLAVFLFCLLLYSFAKRGFQRLVVVFGLPQCPKGAHNETMRAFDVILDVKRIVKSKKNQEAPESNKIHQNQPELQLPMNSKDTPFSGHWPPWKSPAAADPTGGVPLRQAGASPGAAKQCLPEAKSSSKRKPQGSDHYRWLDVAVGWIFPQVTK